MQVSPLTGNALIALHETIHEKVAKLLAGSTYRAGALYIDGAAWVTSIQRADEPAIEIAVDIGDEDMLLAKIGTFV